jgi:hypothetical protein
LLAWDGKPEAYRKDGGRAADPKTKRPNGSLPKFIGRVRFPTHSGGLGFLMPGALVTWFSTRSGERL